jgi:hypothetical protein
VAYIALVVVLFFFLEPVVLFLLVVLVKLVVGVAGAADAAGRLEEPHVGLERERDAGSGAGPPGGSGNGSGRTSRRSTGRREGGASRGERRRQQLQSHGAGAREGVTASSFFLWILICGVAEWGRSVWVWMRTKEESLLAADVELCGYRFGIAE